LHIIVDPSAERTIPAMRHRNTGLVHRIKRPHSSACISPVLAGESLPRGAHDRH
jgi:hypothetical protein